MSRQIFNLRNRLAFLRRRAATEFSRGIQPIGIYTSSGFPESHHRQVVDRSIPAYKTPKNPLESHHRQVVDRSIPAYKTPKNPLESHHRQVVDRSIPTFVFR